jgi:hypothetical protein
MEVASLPLPAASRGRIDALDDAKLRSTSVSHAGAPGLGAGGIKPQSIRRYMLSDDPDFEAKAADVIGLYLNPPQHAAVFCVDEKSHIQALDRLDPVLPLSPGRLERHGFEYYRHGTLSLFAALNTRTGRVLGETVDRHTSEDFVAFLGTIVASSRAKSHRSRQSLDPQDASGSAIPRRSSKGSSALHAHLFVLAEPG